jgi:hypothetical protein
MSGFAERVRRDIAAGLRRQRRKERSGEAGKLKRGRKDRIDGK